MVEQYVYDGTFEGFLTAIYDYYERKATAVQFIKNTNAAENLFDEVYTVHTEEIKADRVWKGLQTKLGMQVARSLYKGFLSEQKDCEKILLHVIKKGFNSQNVSTSFADPDVLALSKLVKMVGREKHRMDAFVRFRKTKDDIYFATIAPDFNVLPLNAIHFKNRYADQKWLIYDLKRKYGVYYDKEKVAYIQLEISKDINKSSEALLYFTEEEMQYQELWKNYFDSTNIKARKNMRLHIQHVPKRYWKYLSEKSE